MDIWIGRNGERNGPYKEADVRQWLRDGQVSGDDLGWYDGLADWQTMATLFPEELPRAGSSVPPPMAPAPLPQTTTASLENYAGFWKRFLAYIIDALVLYIPNRLIFDAMGGAAAQAQLTEALSAAVGNMPAMLAAYSQYYAAVGDATLITTVLAWLYFAFCESSSWQATVGKLALGIRVTDMHGARISIPRALGRYPAKFLSALLFGFGFLMAGWTRRKQGLHDMIVSTLVLNGRASTFNTTGEKPRDPRGNSFSA